MKTTRSRHPRKKGLDLKELIRSSYEKSGIRTPFDKYTRYTIHSSIVSGIGTFVVLTIISIYLSDFLPPIFVESSLVLRLLMYGLISFVVGLLVITIFLLNIVNKTNSRKMRIDTQLLNTSSYIMILSAAGTNPEMILRYAAKENSNVILSNEIQSIVSRMDILGQNIHSALDSAEDESPSKDYTLFLKGLNMTILTGWSLKEYTTNLIGNQFGIYKNKVQQFLDSLNFIAEIYIILLVFFPLFMTIMFSIMSITGSQFGGLGVVTLMYIIGLVLIPLGGIAFLLLCDSIQAGVITGERTATYRGKGLAYVSSILLALIVFISYYAFNQGRAILSDQSIWNRLSRWEATTMTDASIVALIVALIPLSIYYHLDYSRRRSIDEGLPTLARGIGDAGMIGMTLTQAIESSMRESEGPLGEELIKLNADISFNIPIDDALDNFAERCGTALAGQMALLLKAVNKAGENVREGLRLIGEYIEESSNIAKNMNTQMRTGILIIYLSLGVFLVVEYMLATTLFTALSEIDSGLQLGSLVIGAFPYEKIIQVTKISIVMEAILAGLASGKMSTGSIINGFKHILILVTLSFMIFIRLI